MKCVFEDWRLTFIANDSAWTLPAHRLVTPPHIDPGSGNDGDNREESLALHDESAILLDIVCRRDDLDEERKRVDLAHHGVVLGLPPVLFFVDVDLILGGEGYGKRDTMSDTCYGDET